MPSLRRRRAVLPKATMSADFGSERFGTRTRFSSRLDHVAADVDACVQRRASDFVGLLSELVSIPSINPGYSAGSSEAGAQEHLASMLAKWGIESQLREPTVPASVKVEEMTPLMKDWRG